MNAKPVILGAGRVGQALSEAAASAGRECVLVDRNGPRDALSGDAGVPILVATRNDDLGGVLGAVPPHRWGDLVFLQNGAIRDWLEQQGLRRAGRGLLYFAVTERGGPIQAGQASVFTGAHAADVAEWLGAIGVDAVALDDLAFRAREFQKLCWLVVMGPLCERHGATVGGVVNQYPDDVKTLCKELAVLGQAAMGVAMVRRELEDSVHNYSSTIPSYKASVKEWRWRNGWVSETAARLGIPVPFHDTILHQLGHGRS